VKKICGEKIERWHRETGRRSSAEYNNLFTLKIFHYLPNMGGWFFLAHALGFQKIRSPGVGTHFQAA